MKLKNKLTLIMGIGGLNGAVPLAALKGLFKPENAFMISFLFIAGPGAILAASLLDGDIRQRMIAAFLAGLISTIIVVLSAGFGPKLLDIFDLKILEIVGGLAVISIGLLIMGIKVPEKLPTLIMVFGLVLSFISGNV